MRFTYGQGVFTGLRLTRSEPTQDPGQRLPGKRLKKQQRICRSLSHVRKNSTSLTKLPCGNNKAFHNHNCLGEKATSGCPSDSVGIQLKISMAAGATTFYLLKQVLINVCVHPEVNAPLCDEIETSVRAHSWTTAGPSTCSCSIVLSKKYSDLTS